MHEEGRAEMPLEESQREFVGRRGFGARKVCLVGLATLTATAGFASALFMPPAQSLQDPPVCAETCAPASVTTLAIGKRPRPYERAPDGMPGVAGNETAGNPGSGARSGWSR